jgi:spore maturation protein CgeB
VFGRDRGRRAARRLVYEMAWRCQGETAYSAGGWTGRMFFRE